MWHAFNWITKNWISTFFRWDQSRVLCFTIQLKSASLKPFVSSEVSDYMEDILNAHGIAYTVMEHSPDLRLSENFYSMSCINFLNLTSFSPVQRLSYRLDDRSSILGRVKNFFSRRRVQTDPGAHPVSYQVGIGGCTLRVKRPGREADHSLPPNTEVQNSGANLYSLIHLHGLAHNYN
jgi:hypothetical protein